MTIDQFRAWADDKKCSMCGQKATWFAHPESPAYCDRHWPYEDEDSSATEPVDEDDIVQ